MTEQEIQHRKYMKRREYYKQKRMERYWKNHESELEYKKSYRLLNPEKFLKWMSDYKKRTGVIFGRMSQTWSRSIKKQNNNQCQTCGNEAQHAHHILYRKNYPELQFNINNGIALCQKCHYETHGVFT